MDTHGNRRSNRIVLIILAVALGLPALAVAAVIGWHQWSGTPLLDEWACSEGEAPVTAADNGSYCAPEGAELEEGERWNPLGNHPLSCEDRRGWVPVRATGPDQGPSDEGCLAEGKDVPAGWALVD